MNRVTKRYLITLVLGVACPVLIGAPAVAMINSGAGLIGGGIIVGSFVVTAMLVAREKGRSLWYGLAGWIAPLIIVVLLLPHTKTRREELMGGRGSSES